MQGIAQSSAVRRLPALVIVASLVGACAQSVPVTSAPSADAAASGGSSDASASGGSSSTPPVGTATAVPITLQGSPASSVVAGSPYAFLPVAQSSTAVTFAISGTPVWASFDPTTGALSGTPGLTNVGATGAITITATNGSSAAAIGPFNIAVTAPGAAVPPPVSPNPPVSPTPVGTATLSWVAPMLNTSGTPLTDLAGYRIYYGLSGAQMSPQVTLNGPTATSYVVNGLGTGTYYFAVTAFSTQGVESPPSNLASKTF